MNKSGLIYFHQGWTDIINCLPLINYYCKIYNKIFLFIREDSSELLDFFCKQFNNIEILYIRKQVFEERQIVDIFNQFNLDGDFLIHGYSDHFRKDEHNNAFNTKFQNSHFADRFYECYNLDRKNLMKDFFVQRDFAAEEGEYSNFIKKYGENYILCHKTNELEMKNSDDFINLNSITNNFFLYIKILENAKEIHLVDSSWASFCFLLENKYNLFNKNNILIYLYPFAREGGLMPSENKFVEFNNWILK
jgi:hypothetical protein